MKLYYKHQEMHKRTHTRKNTNETECYYEESTRAIVRRKRRKDMREKGGREREGKGLEGTTGSEFTW